MVAGGGVSAGGDGILGYSHDAVWSGIESEIYAIRKSEIYGVAGGVNGSWSDSLFGVGGGWQGCDG